jgi:hypothetical protein
LSLTPSFSTGGIVWCVVQSGKSNGGTTTMVVSADSSAQPQSQPVATPVFVQQPVVASAPMMYDPNMAMAPPQMGYDPNMNMQPMAMEQQPGSHASLTMAPPAYDDSAPPPYDPNAPPPYQ